MLNYNAQRDDRIVELERMVAHRTTLIASLCSCLGMLEDALRRVQEEPPRPSTPEVIDLTLDEEDEYMTSSSVIDLSDTDVEDDVVDLLGGPIEIPIVEREELIVQETPPPQEVMERLRTPIIEEDVRAVDREADLLVREGRALPKYEDVPDCEINKRKKSEIKHIKE